MPTNVHIFPFTQYINMEMGHLHNAQA